MDQGVSCPLPLKNAEMIVLGHGSGGRLTHDLINDVFYKHFSNPILSSGNDAAILIDPIPSEPGKFVTSTDAHVVDPLTFPGGDIGKLAICGTVNDVSMMGAKPLYITATFIIEEGMQISELEKYVQSMQQACQEAGVIVVSGDTKVIPKGKADKLFISTTGIGWLPESRSISGDLAKPGDTVIISGSIGDHGIAVLQARGDLGFSSDIRSDVAPLNHMIELLLENVPCVHVFRDPTRGGLATTLVEIANQSKVTIQIEEEKIPVRPEVSSTCSMLGLDPLFIANEGKVIIILPAKYADKALKIVQNHEYGRNAMCIGSVIGNSKGEVLLRTPFGTNRVLNMLSGEMLPRIC
jgi:hydrogenase expression/formation protein HypE